MTNSNEEILLKIKKLMSLSNSANEHESALAARKAQEMLQTYNLEMADVLGLEDTTADPVGAADVVYTKRNRIVWKSNLASTIARNNNCKLVMSGVKLVFIGRKSSVETVKFLYSDLSIRLEAMARTAHQRAAQDGDTTHGRVWINSWLMGAVVGVGSQLYEAKKAFEQQVSAKGNTGMALVLVRDAEVKIATKKLFPHLTTAHYSGSTRSYSAFGAGRHAGSTMNIHSGNLAAGSRRQIGN